MVVGGMCGFGFEVVKWMVEFGVKIIVFVVCLEFLELKFLEVFELKELIGVNIVLYQVDVLSLVSMKVLEDRFVIFLSVVGIVYLVMVFRDELILNLIMISFREVFVFKVKGN